MASRRGKGKRPFGVVTGRGEFVRQETVEQYAVKSGEVESGQIRKGEDIFGGLYGLESLQEPRLSPMALIRLPEINTYHRRACQTKAEDIAGVGVEVVPEYDGKEGSERDKETLEVFIREQPAPFSSTLRKFQYDYEVLGYGAIELVREGNRPDGDPVGLFHVPAHTVRVHRRGDRYRQKRGRVDRWFKDVDFDIPIDRDTGQATSNTGKMATELMWFQNYDPEDDYYGCPDIVPALDAIKGEQGRSKYNIAFFDNYGIPSWAVFITGDYEEGEKEDNGKTALENMIEDTLRGFSDEPHSPAVFYIPSAQTGGGSKEELGRVEVNFERLDTEVKDASFEMYRTANRDEVITSHAVPPYRMGLVIEGSLGGNVARETTEIYKHSVIGPREEALESVFLRYLIKGGFGIEGWKIKLREIDTRDREADRNHVVSLVNAGLMTPNEGREMLGIDKINDDPNMDVIRPPGGQGQQGTPDSLSEKLIKLAEQAGTSDVADEAAARGKAETGGKLEREPEEVVESLNGPDGEEYEWQVKSCDDPACERCNARIFHGPYLYRITYVNGNPKVEYVRLKEAQGLGFTRPGTMPSYAGG